jgi:hypothetical protein
MTIDFFEQLTGLVTGETLEMIVADFWKAYHAM